MAKKRKRQIEKFEIKIWLIIAVCIALLLGAIYTDYFGLCSGLLFGGVGVLALWWMKKGFGIVHRGFGIFVGIILVAMGTGMIGASLGYHLLDWREGIQFGIFEFGVGMLILLATVWDVYSVFLCKELAEVRCTHITNMRARYVGAMYMPMYEFEWEGKSYRTQRGKAFLGRGICKFKVGRSYHIYINPKNPMMVRENRSPGFLFLWGSLFGIMLVRGGLEQLF